ncbi:MAG: IS200/IS605 family transposase [Marinifilaceae bacterium]
MGQSLAKLYIHLIIGTKDKVPIIEEEWEDQLYANLLKTLKQLECPSLIINGANDHVHLLLRLSPDIALEKLVEEVKEKSAQWIKESHEEFKEFAWQKGYVAFSVSASKLEIVKAYIANQKKHHTRTTYLEEVQDFVKSYDLIEFDEKHFWN